MPESKIDELRFDEIGCSPVCPVFDRKVADVRQYFAVPVGVLRFVLLQKMIEGFVATLASPGLPNVVQV